MPFPVQADMTKELFKSEIIDHYWTPDFQKTINASTDTPAHDQSDVASLVDDFCKIGAFMSSKDKVLTALKPLEERLRLAAQGAIKNTIEGFNPKQPATFKSNKLLSGVLGQFEITTGFNNPELFYKDAQAKLHSEAHVGKRGADDEVETDADSKLPKFEKVGLTKAVTLPKGVPRAMGNVTGRDFNRILLRHGYHFKDVGAGIDHGEYTHRLHWFALAHAGLELANPLPFLYRSMGSLWAGGGQNVPNGKVYIWEALFDCFPSRKAAEAQKSVAFSDYGCCNCPDYLNLELCDPKKLEALAYVEGNADNLWCLRVLMTSRKLKRIAESQLDNQTGFDKLATKIGSGKKAYGEAYISPSGKNERAGLGGLLVWYLNG
jgi:hypothetical protein